MKMSIINIKLWFLASALVTCAPCVQAYCYKVTSIGKLAKDLPQAVADKGYTAADWGGVLNAVTAPISFGTIIMGTGAEKIAPAGTVIASAKLEFLDSALTTHYAANQIVFKCALSDADSLYEMYALNAAGGTFYGGTAVTDAPNAYQTPSSNIAFRISNLKTGMYYTQYWQQRKLTPDDYIVEDSWVYVPASAFSGILYELVKSEDSYGVPARNAFNNIVAPQGFIAFKGNGINTDVSLGAWASSPGDAKGTSAVWSMRNGTTTVLHGNTCTITDFDQLVVLPPISDNDLRNGKSSSENFNFSIDCEKGAISGTTSDDNNAPVAVGSSSSTFTSCKPESAIRCWRY